MAARLLSALVGVPIVAGAIWAGPPWLTFLVVLAAVLGLVEFNGMVSRAGAAPRLSFGVVWSLLFVLDARLDGAFTAPLVVGGILASVAWFLARPQHPGLLADWAATLVGPLCVGLLLSRALLLRQAEHGQGWLMLAVLATFATDTGAYFSGRALGRHRMAPSISPHKTWEGALGGWLSGVGAAIALGVLLGLPAALWQVAVLGVLVGVLAQVGDLAESLLKRGAGVKDAGRLIPGHGGILDRLDSVVFTIPAVYYALELGFSR